MESLSDYAYDLIENFRNAVESHYESDEAYEDLVVSYQELVEYVEELESKE